MDDGIVGEEEEMGEEGEEREEGEVREDRDVREEGDEREEGVVDDDTAMWSMLYTWKARVKGEIVSWVSSSPFYSIGRLTWTA